MPTTIKFTVSQGDRVDSITVQEEPHEVQEAFNAGHGQPFRLEKTNGGAVFVNPQNVAYWSEHTPARMRTM